jgi:glyoxylase-like metal-dependent hydrolase (beta-lactamase superfamily II)
MPLAPELHRIAQDLLLWHAYDPHVKAELFSTAITTKGQIWLVDPIPLPAGDLGPRLEPRSVAGIIVTNANHWRAAPDLAARFSVQIHAHRANSPGEGSPPVQVIEQDGLVTPTLEAISIEGAALGELALFCSLNKGTLIVGDALINFEPYGFARLPRKYCTDEKQMVRSLNKLLDRDFERLLFAHGTPILSYARARLETLLRS